MVYIVNKNKNKYFFPGNVNKSQFVINNLRKFTPDQNIEYSHQVIEN